MLLVAALVAGATAASRASPQIDTAHAATHRRDADACILRAVIIYTDPYIGGQLSNARIVADIAHMCARPFRLYSEDMGLDAAAARRRLRRTIEAGLRGQLREEPGWPASRDAW